MPNKHSVASSPCERPTCRASNFVRCTPKTWRAVFSIKCPVCEQTSEKVIRASEVLQIVADPEKLPNVVVPCDPPLQPIRIEEGPAAV